MKCVIAGSNVRALGRAVHALSRIGDELYLEPTGTSSACSARCPRWRRRWSAACCCCGPAPAAWWCSCTASTVSGAGGTGRGRGGAARLG
uniref:Uncharacterized protein n=1 Tax=Anas platyrhynchos TaxID=8839 RepID=A0A8B9QTV4_ANAPL